MGGHVCLPHTVPSHTWLLGTSGLEGTHKTPANHPPLHLVERLWGEPPARIPSPRPVPGLPPPRSNVLRAGWWPGTGGGGGAVVTAQCLPCLLPVTPCREALPSKVAQRSRQTLQARSKRGCSGNAGASALCWRTDTSGAPYHFYVLLGEEFQLVFHTTQSVGQTLILPSETFVLLQQWLVLTLSFSETLELNDKSGCELCAPSWDREPAGPPAESAHRAEGAGATAKGRHRGQKGLRCHDPSARFEKSSPGGQATQKPQWPPELPVPTPRQGEVPRPPRDEKKVEAPPNHWAGIHPPAPGARMWPSPCSLTKFYWHQPGGLDSSPALVTSAPFHREFWKWAAAALRPEPLGPRGPEDPPRPPAALTSSFLSSDSKAFRSSSFRMMALSSAILSWKRRASFSSNCCS